MAKSTRNEADRAVYKSGALAMLATLDELRASGDEAIVFWRDEIGRALARHLTKLGTVQARATIQERNTGKGATTADRMQLERDAAILAAESARRAVRAVRGEDREVGRWTAEIERERDELRLSLEAARSSLAQAEREREYWRTRAEQSEAWVIEPEVTEDPRVTMAFAECAIPF